MLIFKIQYFFFQIYAAVQMNFACQGTYVAVSGALQKYLIGPVKVVKSACESESEECCKKNV